MFSAFRYIIIIAHCQTRFDLLFSIIMNCVTYSVLYENLTCSISTRLNSLERHGKWTNGTGKWWKTDIKRCWKVTENHFQCSVHTLLITKLIGYWREHSLMFVVWQSSAVSEGDGWPSDAAGVAESVHVSCNSEQDPWHSETIATGSTWLWGPAEWRR